MVSLSENIPLDYTTVQNCHAPTAGFTLVLRLLDRAGQLHQHWPTQNLKGTTPGLSSLYLAITNPCAVQQQVDAAGHMWIRRLNLDLNIDQGQESTAR